MAHPIRSIAAVSAAALLAAAIGAGPASAAASQPQPATPSASAPQMITVPADAPEADPADVMPIPEAATAWPAGPRIAVQTDASPDGPDPAPDLPVHIGEAGLVGTGDVVLAGRVLAAATLDQVVVNIRTWIVAMLAGLATLFLTIGGLRYLMAGGDPAEVEKAKTALKSSMIGYSLAVLAPVLLTVLQSMLGAS